ncbi:MAG: hypothetical protein Q8S09_08245 [Hyphomonas sp.]|nr:hypothetical protein [Hyphomonas sp.]
MLRDAKRALRQCIYYVFGQAMSREIFSGRAPQNPVPVAQGKTCATVNGVRLPSPWNKEGWGKAESDATLVQQDPPRPEIKSVDASSA